MKIVVDWSLCDGNGLCAAEIPDFLAIDKDDMLHVLKATVEEHDLERVRRAVQVCPKCALRIAQ